MGPEPDPFAHHPELRDKISDPLQSFFRSFDIAEMAERIRENGLPTDWWYSDGEREASRAQELANCWGKDLWVFAYGSLMWDPAFRFAEVRRAYVPGYARRFILKDVHGGRGTRAAPGLMAALDSGPGCNGLVFRIEQGNLDAETEIIWRRERIGPGYLPTFVEATLSDRSIEALTFVADHDAPIIDAGLTRAEQIRYLATGTGFLGSSLDYLKNIAEHFSALGIEDEEVSELLRETEAYIAAAAR